MNVRVSLLALSLVFAMTFAMSGVSHADKARYTCSGGTKLTAVFSGAPPAPGSVKLSIAGTRGAITLPQVMSADGGRYAEGGTEFWIKGNAATLQRMGKSETCRAR
jgi:membrane-bound inhibitor of C-type lysozyme